MRNKKGAVALANIFAGRQPYFPPKMASKSVTVPIPFYKRSSFIDIPFGMPYFKLFYFQLSKSMPFLMQKGDFPSFLSESYNEVY